MRSLWFGFGIEERGIIVLLFESSITARGLSLKPLIDTQESVIEHIPGADLNINPPSSSH